MNNPFFNNNRPSTRRFGFGQPPKHQTRQAHPSLNFTDNFADFPVCAKTLIAVGCVDFFSQFQSHSILHNSTMIKSRPNFNRSFSNDPNSSSMFTHSATPGEKPSFSSLFTSGGGSRNPSTNFSIEPFSSESQSPDDDGVYLQISNLDQWYDEANLRNYLMSQLKPITPILSLSIETPSIAKVRVPSLQVNFHPETSIDPFTVFSLLLSLPSRSFRISIARKWATSGCSCHS